ncbi:hypothetical protein Riv7116_6572 [Rivularia sp. PCC 7116]|uniref:hypothetical protein n=1 Tax=Rivularia sp. PCC 7116 TaxID=373994 RepID=UPI00029F36F2|nr:hypothetical protein [Rivularia sp. PCC 7116]AFY58899.1 hypothetical protein Riv7116_6572 [Rivularia sp. PCC 7116]
MPPNNPPPSNSQYYTQMLLFIKQTLGMIFSLLRWLVVQFWRLLKRVYQFLRRQKTDKIIAIIVLLLSVGILLGNYVFRGSYNFEGSVIAKEISFEYTGNSEKLFFDQIQGIQNLQIEGKQPEALVFTGKFSSKSDPTLNEKLIQMDSLTMEFPNSTSTLMITPTQFVNNQLSILELRLFPESQVSNLTYESKEAQLSLCLLDANLLSKTCLSSQGLPETKKTKQIGNLRVKLGEEKLQFNLAGVNIPELDIRSDDDYDEELSLELESIIDDITFTLLTPTELTIKLPNPAKSQKDDLDEWIWRDLDVSKVNFTRLENTGNVKDQIEISTIISGKVRMNTQVMELQPEQFLIIPSKQPGIRKLRSVSINSKSSQGLQTLFSGESQSIAVGLYPEFPVQTIKPSWLSKYLSPEAVSALLAFFAALTGVLLPRLFS